MGNESKIHNLLNGSGGKHGKAGLTAAHNVAMVAENAQGMISERARGYVENARQKLAGDFEHVGDHKQKTLRGCKGGGQSTGLERAVHGARGTRFGLHLSDLHLLAEKVGPAVGSPLVGNFRHWRRRGDGVDGGYITERIGNMRRGGIAVNGHCFCHFKNSS